LKSAKEKAETIQRNILMTDKQPELFLSYGKRIGVVVASIRLMENDDFIKNIKERFPDDDIMSTQESSKEERVIKAYIKQCKIPFKHEAVKNIKAAVKHSKKDLFYNHSNLNLISISPVQGTGFNPSNTVWRPKDHLCVVLFCTAKGTIPIGEPRFPQTLKFQNEIFTVDVREGYVFSASRFCQTINVPLCLGCSIGKENCKTAGSVGPLVREEDNKDNVGFLTCYHVFFPEETAPTTTQVSVVQPSFYECDINQNLICGTVQDAIKSGIDAAYVKMTSRIPHTSMFSDGTGELI